MVAEIDAIDRKLLELLQEDGRIPQNELAKAVNLAVSSVNDRIRKMLERGIIEGIYAHISAQALGLDLLAYVFVGWSDSTTEPAFLAAIKPNKSVLECHHVTGAWNYLMKVQLRNTATLEKFLGQLKRDVPGLQRTETLICLSSPKETCRHDTDVPGVT